jgi:pseudaminic acid synthase
MGDVSTTVLIGDRQVGAGERTYVIAELSANHMGELDRAIELIGLAAEAGADAIKLQTYTADTMTIDSDREPFLIGEGTLWSGRRLYDLYDEASTPWEWHGELFAAGRAAGLDVFSTPFDVSAVDFLEDFEPPAYKIASFELVDLDLIAYTASKGRPLIISTGMATVDEIDDAVSTANAAGAPGVVLLRCNSAYPADPSEMDLRTIPDMATRWSVPIGLSDHTLDEVAALVAVSLGACVLEKHLTLRRSEPGPDSAFSLEPAELAALVTRIREAEASLGTTRYGPSPSERASVAFRRSLFVVHDVAAGQRLTAADVRSIRPADGLPPKERAEVIGRRVTRDLERGTPLSWDVLESPDL